MNVQELREAVRKAFSNLRKQGFVAKMNYLCCGSCAGSNIGADFDKKVLEGLQPNHYPKGVVFFHQQDNQYFEDKGVLYLCYGDIEGSESKAKTELPTLEVGKKVIETLIEAGIPQTQIEWDGDENTCIKVTATIND
jgi:hypothetical protein